MGIRAAHLTAAVLFLLPGTGAFAAARSGCLDCHPVHYAESGACTYCHGGDGKAKRETIAHLGLHPAKYSYFRMEESPPVRRGLKLLETSGCRRCHVSGGKGIRLSADLDSLMYRSDPERIAEAIRSPAWYMPDFRFGEEAIDGMVNAILSASARTGKPAGETPVKVHFEDKGAEDVFSRHCGPCHKALTARHGGLGKGNIGPNLSALFTAEYPKTARGKKPWTPERLRAWIANPRKERPAALMPPVRSGEKDFLQIVERLRIDRDRIRD
ncbi:MAG: selenite/tellurite reduction operon c-type cytochrome lipoprotein ExtS [Thermodesulfobacteriota bacterium]